MAAKRTKRLERLTAFDWVVMLFMAVFSFITIYPIWYVLIGSFNQGMDYGLGGVFFFPRVFSLDNYAYVLSDLRVLRGFLVTIGRTVLGTVGHILVTYLVAHAMSRSYFKLRKPLSVFFLIPMFFGGGFIPYYVCLHFYKLLNTFWVYILPGLFSTYDMLVFLSFLRSVPEELREAAVIDGASEYRIALTLILPLCKPVLATIALWQIVGHWNNYFDSMWYCPTQENLWSIQYVVKNLLSATSAESNPALTPQQLETISATTISYAAIIVSVLPITAVYPLLQKHFAKGFMLGSLKV